MAISKILKSQLANLGIIDADVAAGAGILTTKLADGSKFIKSDGTVTYTAAQNFGGFKAQNLADPTLAQDAVTLGYLQSFLSTGSNKITARLLPTGNVTVSNPGTSTFDGVAANTGDILLLANQTAGAENGPYIFNGSTSALTRYTAASIKPGLFVFVSEGTNNGNNGYTLTTDDPITVGTTSLLFTQTSGAGQIVAGNGITKTGNTLAVLTANSGRIVVTGTGIDLATTAVTPGTYTYSTTTVDAYGRLTSVTAGVAPVTSVSGTAGRIASSGGTTPVLDLIAAGTAGTYTKVTTDTYGRVSSGTTLALTDLPSGTVTSTNYIIREVPSGTQNGTNTAFTLAFTPVTGKESVYLNGQLLNAGAGNDYTISGAAITTTYAPVSTDVLLVNYLK